MASFSYEISNPIKFLCLIYSTDSFISGGLQECPEEEYGVVVYQSLTIEF